MFSNFYGAKISIYLNMTKSSSIYISKFHNFRFSTPIFLDNIVISLDISRI